jgi:plastocyanin
VRRAIVVGVVVVTGLLGPGAAVVGASPAKAPPPVKLSGKVTVTGTKTVKKGRIDLEQDDFYFNPTFIKAKAGSTIKVKLENEGSASHTFTIDKLSIDKEVAPDKTATVSVKVPKTGAVAFYCRFHKSKGMQGAIFSKAGSTAKATKSTSGGGSYGY